AGFLHVDSPSNAILENSTFERHYFSGGLPLTDFIGDSDDLPIGPYTSYSYSSGGHNGPTLGHVLDYWIPTSIGDYLSWSGTSTANLTQGELLFSTLAGTLNGGVAANFEVANRTDRVPEPATLALMGLGLAGIGFARKKKAA
ncbi:MAG: PEP-CTERM sorting domain-containing protein, partial [Sedimenticola sp.]